MGLKVISNAGRAVQRMFAFLPRELTAVAVQIEAMCDIMKGSILWLKFN